MYSFRGTGGLLYYRANRANGTITWFFMKLVHKHMAKECGYLVSNLRLVLTIIFGIISRTISVLLVVN